MTAGLAVAGCDAAFLAPIITDVGAFAILLGVAAGMARVVAGPAVLAHTGAALGFAVDGAPFTTVAVAGDSIIGGAEARARGGAFSG